MSLAQGNNTPTRPRIEPGSPDPESDALTTRPVRSPRRFLNGSIIHAHGGYPGHMTSVMLIEFHFLILRSSHTEFDESGSVVSEKSKF